VKIMVCTMEDPVYTVPFIKEVVRARAGDVCALVVAGGNRLTIGRKRSRKAYLASLALIMGPVHFARYAARTVGYRARVKLAERAGMGRSPSLEEFARELGIPFYRVPSVNDPAFLAEARRLAPDVIINQTQNILKRDFLSVARLGVLNRHNALLPLNRGRLTPFWVLYKGEARTGVSIHFVDEGIDSGPILVQKSFPVEPGDDFNAVVRKNYRIAGQAMLEALDLLEAGLPDTLPNDDARATYNTVPTFREALEYRVGRIRRLVGR
jgi:methionyl-tRNA formyltransferase